MKVKSDHRSEFSNLSNWKEEAWKNQGFDRIWTIYYCSANMNYFIYTSRRNYDLL